MYVLSGVMGWLSDCEIVGQESILSIDVVALGENT